MTGESFCKAAEDAFYLSARNAARLGTVHGLGTVFTFTGEIFITLLVSVLSYAMVTHIGYYKDNLFNPIIPAVVSLAVAY